MRATVSQRQRPAPEGLFRLSQTQRLRHRVRRSRTVRKRVADFGARPEICQLRQAPGHQIRGTRTRMLNSHQKSQNSFFEFIFLYRVTWTLNFCEIRYEMSSRRNGILFSLETGFQNHRHICSYKNKHVT